MTLFIVLMGAMNLATVRRSEDPIRDTQTDPILYKQKMEQEKDGVKGPLLYNVKYNPKDTFFVDPPFVKQTGSILAPVGGAEAKPADTANWWEEQPVETEGSLPESREAAAPPSGKTAAGREETLSESAPTDQISPESTPAPDTSSSSEASKEDYWW